MKKQNILLYAASAMALSASLFLTACNSGNKNAGAQNDETPVVSAEDLEQLAAAMPKYSIVCSFRDGRAAVCDKETDLWGFIDMSGEEVIPCQYQYIANEFSEGAAIVSVSDEEKFIIDRDGNKVAPFNYNYYGNGFPDGLIAFIQPNPVDENGDVDWMHFGKIGYMDKSGKIVIPADTYDVMLAEGPITYDFSEGLCRQYDCDNYSQFFIDKTGKKVFDCDGAAGDFHEGLVAMWKYDEAVEKCFYGFVDKTGKLVIPRQFTSAGHFSEGLCWAVGDGKAGFIDKEGKWVIEGNYKLISLYEDTEGEEALCPSFSEGLAWVCNGEGKFGYIDRDGNVVVPFRYEPGTDSGGGEEWYDQQPVFDFHQGIARVWDKATQKYGYIDREGNEVFPCQFDRAEDMSEGLAVVQRGDLWGFITPDGRCTLEK